MAPSTPRSSGYDPTLLRSEQLSLATLRRVDDVPGNSHRQVWLWTCGRTYANICSIGWAVPVCPWHEVGSVVRNGIRLSGRRQRHLCRPAAGKAHQFHPADDR